jgi:hypothetical protein
MAKVRFAEGLPETREDGVIYFDPATKSVVLNSMVYAGDAKIDTPVERRAS